MAKPSSIKIRLNSSADTGFFYVTKKNNKTMTEKMQVRKYDPVAKKHVLFKEGKIKQLNFKLYKTYPELNTLQISNISKPLIVCDADEVIFDFMSSFEKYLQSNNLYFSWNSYALNGNILNSDNKAVNTNEVHNIINNFFKSKTANMKLVKGVKSNLHKLAQSFNILILSNIPFEFYKERKKALKKYDLNFPFFANKGPKGKAVAYITKIYKGDIWFIDDSPYQIKSVKQEAKNTSTILFIANKKLEDLMNNKKYGDFYSNTWKRNTKIILNCKNNL